MRYLKVYSLALKPIANENLWDDDDNQDLLCASQMVEEGTSKISNVHFQSERNCFQSKSLNSISDNNIQVEKKSHGETFRKQYFW